jgi:hypothetical protein
VTLERVIVGASTLHQCHCKACGASWPNQDEKPAQETGS